MITWPKGGRQESSSLTELIWTEMPLFRSHWRWDGLEEHLIAERYWANDGTCLLNGLDWFTIDFDDPNTNHHSRSFGRTIRLCDLRHSQIRRHIHTKATDILVALDNAERQQVLF